MRVGLLGSDPTPARRGAAHAADHLVLATVKLGAAVRMLNYHQRNKVLSHSIDLLRSRVLVVGPECRAAVDQLDRLSAAVVDADEIHEAATAACDADPDVCAEITAGEPAFLIFTSGTTGLPKARGKCPVG